MKIVNSLIAYIYIYIYITQLIEFFVVWLKKAEYKYNGIIPNWNVACIFMHYYVYMCILVILNNIIDTNFKILYKISPISINKIKIVSMAVGIVNIRICTLTLTLTWYIIGLLIILQQWCCVGYCKTI